MKKLVGLSLIIMLGFSFSSVAQTIETNPLTEKASFDDDVPTWKLEDYWTLGVDTFLFQLNESGQFIELDLTVNDLTILVESQTETSYQLDISGKIEGNFLYDDGAEIRLSGTLYFTRISGSIQVRKADLAAEHQEIIITSIALLTEHPLNISFPIPIPLKITLDVEQTTPRPLVDFPLFDGKMGLLPEVQISTNIKVESIVLRILHIFIPDIPEEIILDKAINAPLLQYSTSVEEVNVTAGSYTAYNIAFYEGLLGSVYYAPEAGNFIKAEAELEIPDQLLIRFEGELKETNYIP